MEINKVILRSGSTLETAVDLSSDTATAADVAQGKTFHLANGEIGTGLAVLGQPEEISTAAEMDNLLVSANIGKVYLYTGTTTATYTNGNLYLVEESN